MLHRVPFENMSLSEEDATQAGHAFMDLCDSVLRSAGTSSEMLVFVDAPEGDDEERNVVQITDRARIGMDGSLRADITRHLLAPIEPGTEDTTYEWYAMDISQR